MDPLIVLPGERRLEIKKQRDIERVNRCGVGTNLDRLTQTWACRFAPIAF